MSDTITIVIADDHPIVRRGLRAMIEDDPALRIVGEASDGNEAVRAVIDHRPDVVVLDLDMPGRDGFGVVREMRARELPGAVIVLTLHGEADLLNEALGLGVGGYIIKDSTATDIAAAIKAVHRGRHFISPALSSHLIARGAAPPLRNRTDIDTLTPAELKILRLVAEGQSSKEIAEANGIHYRTVENHRVNICAKLDLHGSHALLKFAILNKSSL